MHQKSGDWHLIEATTFSFESLIKEFSALEKNAPQKTSRLLSFARGQCNPAAINEVLEYADADNIPLFSKAALLGDSGFFGTMMANMPIDRYLERMNRPNEFGATPLNLLRVSNPDVGSHVVKAIEESVSVNNTDPLMLAMHDSYVQVGGNIPLKPLDHAERYVFVDVPASAILCDPVTAQAVSLSTCLARCGYYFGSPESVFRQVFFLSNLASGSDIIIRDQVTGELFSGNDSLKFLTLSKNMPPIKKWAVFVQCSQIDGDTPVDPATTSLIVQSSGKMGAQKISWNPTSELCVYPSLLVPVTVSAFLAPQLKKYSTETYFMESLSGNTNCSSDMVLINEETKSFVRGKDAVLVAGSFIDRSLNRLGYRVFSPVNDADQTIPPLCRVISCEHGKSHDTNESMLRQQANPNRFLKCTKYGSTIGATLRENDIYYAALDAIYVSLHHGSLDAYHDTDGIAIPAGNGPITEIITGALIFELGKEESFWTKYRIYVPCSSVNEQLIYGCTVILDQENLFPLPPTNRKLAILRYYPSIGTTQDHDAVDWGGKRIRDKGHNDDHYLKGFCRGWYDGVYWRVVDAKNFIAHTEDKCLTGGIPADPFRFKIILKDHDLGYDNKRIMVKIPGIGVVYCRGVGEDKDNPDMACILFHPNGDLYKRLAYHQQLCKWKDIFH